MQTSTQLKSKVVLQHTRERDQKIVVSLKIDANCAVPQDSAPHRGPAGVFRREQAATERLLEARSEALTACFVYFPRKIPTLLLEKPVTV